MKETAVILVVVATLLALTAIRYRRQIVAIINLYKEVRAVREGLKGSRSGAMTSPPKDGIPLVKCTRCEKWISENDSIRSSDGVVCVKACETPVHA